MKKFLVSAVLLSAALGCSAMMKQALTLHMESGANIVYFLDTEPSISFKGQTMTVTVDNAPTDIPMQDVDRWEIGMAEFSAVEAIAGPAGVGIAVYGNSVTINNPGESGITVYNIGGQVVGSTNESEATMTLAPGIYVITVANNPYKIAIR